MPAIRSPADTEKFAREQYELYGMAWSPSGHQLAVANPAGVLVTDPATGALNAFIAKTCYQVIWYDLPETTR